MIEAKKHFDAIHTDFDKLHAITRRDIDKKRIQTIDAAADGYAATMDDFLGNWQLLQKLGQERDRARKDLIAAAKITADAALTSTQSIAEDASSRLSSANMILLVGLLMAAGLGITMALVITRGITKPIQKIITGLSGGANQVDDASDQVSSASQTMAEGASQQASSLEQVVPAGNGRDDPTKRRQRWPGQRRSCRSK